MKYSIKILQENLDRLNSRYEKFVSNGSVEITSIIALDNRKKANDLQQAITELNQALQLQQTGVIKSVCKHCNNQLCDSQTFNQQCFQCGKKPQ